jgi:hypothetical protein
MAQVDSRPSLNCPTCGGLLLYLGGYLPRDGIDRTTPDERANVTHIYRCPDHLVFRLGPNGLLTPGV